MMICRPAHCYNAVQDGSRTDGAVELAISACQHQLHGQCIWSGNTGPRCQPPAQQPRSAAGWRWKCRTVCPSPAIFRAVTAGFGADLGLQSPPWRRFGSLCRIHSAGRPDQIPGWSRKTSSPEIAAAHWWSARGTAFSDSLSVFGENRVSVGSDAPTLARSFGLQFEPSEEWSVTSTFENGRIEDAATGVLRRTAGSLAVGYSTDDIRAGAAFELRNENRAAIGTDTIVDTGTDQTVWLVRSNFSYAVNPDWRFVSQFNMARADNEGTSIRAAEFTEAIAGFAWRPVDNDRVNGLDPVPVFRRSWPGRPDHRIGRNRKPQAGQHDLQRRFQLRPVATA